MRSAHRCKDECIPGPLHVNQVGVTRHLRVADIDLDGRGILVVGSADAVRRRQRIAGAGNQAGAKEQDDREMCFLVRDRCA